MADARTCANLGLFQGLVRFAGVPLVACQWPRCSSPDTPAGATPGTTAEIKKRGAQPYLRAHAPLPDTPRTVILRLLPKGRIKAM